MHKIFRILKTCLKDKYFISGGRADRSEFWYYTGFHALMRVVLYPLSGIHQYLEMVLVMISFALFVPNYTVLLRRLHDTDRSGRELFILVVGLATVFTGFVTSNELMKIGGEILSAVGAVYLLYLCSKPGNSEANIYGPVPGSEESVNAPSAKSAAELRKKGKVGRKGNKSLP